MVTYAEMVGEAPAETPEIPSLITGEMMTQVPQQISWEEMQGGQPKSVTSGFGWKDAAQIADLLLGVPTWLATMGARGALDIGATIRGIPDPMQASSEKIEAAMQTPWMRFLQAPIQTATEMRGQEDTMVGKGLEAVGEGIVDLGEYLAKETGYEGFKELMPRLADLAMVGAGKAGHVAVTKFKARNARLLKEAQAAMEKETVKQEAAVWKARVDAVKSDPYFDQFPELPIWLTKEKVAVYVKTLQADPKVEAKLAEMAKKPMEGQFKELVDHQTKTGKTVKAEDFKALEEKMDELLKKPVGKLTSKERASLEDYVTRRVAALEQGGFIDRKMAPYIFATLGAGSIAATYAVAQYFQEQEEASLSGVEVLVGALAVTKAGRIKLAAKLKAAPSDLFRNKILVEGARAGDPAAIERIYKDNAKPLERSIATFDLPPGIDAADVVARVMEKFFTDTIKRPKEAKGGFRGDSKVSSFLYGAVRNEATNAMQRGKLSERSLDLDVSQEVGGKLPLSEIVPDVSSNLEAAALNERLAMKMDKAMQDLPKNYREVVERVLLEGKSYEQTAQELGIPVGTVRSQLNRAKSQLQGRLREYTDKEVGKADPLLLGLTGLAGTAAALGAYLDSDMPLRGAMLGAIGVPGFYWLRKVGVGEGLDLALGRLSTRLEIHGNTALKFRARVFEKDLMGNTDKALTEVSPFLKGLNKLPEAVKEQLNQALLMNDGTAIAAALKGRPEMVDAWRKVQSLLADFRKQQIALGRFKKGLTDYFPRIVKDYEGLKKSLNQEQRTHLEETLLKAEAKSQKELSRPLTDVERAIIIDNSLKYTGSEARLPAFAKQRGIKDFTEDLIQFYASPTESLLRYIRGAVEDIETAKFFGAHLKTRKVEGRDATDINDSIGELVDSGLRDGTITFEGADKVRAMLRARFVGGAKAPHEALQAIRDVTNIALLGNFLAAATQLGDAPMALYHHGLRPTLEAVKGKLTGNSQISTKDFGMVNHVVEELASAQATGRWVQTAFKYSTFAAIDQFGKNLNLQAGLIKNQRLSMTDAGKQVLFDRYGDAFGQDFMQLIMDLQSGKITDGVKSVLFSELSDAQPISKMEMPQLYNEHPNGRILWQMKSFMLTQGDIIRRDGFQQIAKGNYVKGATAIVAFGLILAAAQAPAKMVKDWISGRKVDFGIDLVQNLLETFGISRYTLEQIDRSPGRGTEDFLTGMVTPPAVSIVANILDKPEKAVKYMPLVGRAIYDRELGGNIARARAERRRQGPLTAVEKRAAAFRRKVQRMRNPKR